MGETVTALDGSGDDYTRLGFHVIREAHSIVWGAEDAGEVELHALGRSALGGVDAGFLSLSRRHINSTPDSKTYGSN